MNFIKLPSGTYINAEKVVWAAQVGTELRYRLHGDADNWNTEVMPLDDFLALLQPQGTPIVDCVLNLDKLKPGSACQFTYEGQVKHGVIEVISHSSSESYIQMISNGDRFILYPRRGQITPY